MSTDLIQHAFHGQAVRVITDEHGTYAETGAIKPPGCGIEACVGAASSRAGRPEPVLRTRRAGPKFKT